MVRVAPFFYHNITLEIRVSSTAPSGSGNLTGTLCGSLTWNLYEPIVMVCPTTLSGRYVSLQAFYSAAYALHLYEVQVFGPSDYPDPSQPLYIPDGYPPSSNLAINKTSTAIATLDPSYPPSNGNDGNRFSQWNTNSQSTQLPIWWVRGCHTLCTLCRHICVVWRVGAIVTAYIVLCACVCMFSL